MKVLITGSDGQLGFELARTAPASVELILTNRQTLDITNSNHVLDVIAQHRPDVIINGAAYTAVDKAEGDAERAQAVNGSGVAHLADAAKQHHARLVQISTDFVFDGRQSSPYNTDAQPLPMSIYGSSKLAGEQAVINALGNNALILRTAWVYSSHGNNFVKTILRLVREKPQLGIVADQIGTPTWAGGLAGAVWRALDTGLTGIHHWTDAGVASWYDFAIAIQEEALSLGLIDRQIPILPIRTTDYPLPAPRPPYSVLNKHPTWLALDLQADHWRVALRRMLSELPH